MRFFLIFLFFISSCGKAKVPDPQPLTKHDLLAEANKAKAKAMQERFGPTGWPSTHDCDALLWAGLAKASGIQLDLSLAEYEPGKMERRPLPSCYPGESVSTVSRDMILGYLWGVWNSHDWAALTRFADRTNDKKGVMGEPYPEQIGEVLINPNMMGLTGRMLCQGGVKCPDYKDLPRTNSESDQDYVQHLTVLYILLNQEVGGEKHLGPIKNLKKFIIGKDDLDVLHWHAEKNPKDALFQAALHTYSDGDFNGPTDMLLSSDFACPSYVRGDNNYCDVHWLFVASLILSKYD